jgi:hypothetical protein
MGFHGSSWDAKLFYRFMKVNQAWLTDTALACDLRNWLQLPGCDGDMAAPRRRSCAATCSTSLPSWSAASGDNSRPDPTPTGGDASTSPAAVTGATALHRQTKAGHGRRVAVGARTAARTRATLAAVLSR